MNYDNGFLHRIHDTIAIIFYISILRYTFNINNMNKG